MSIQDYLKLVQDHIKLEDLYTQLAAGFVLLLIGWLTGLFRVLWRLVPRSVRRGVKVKRNSYYAGWYTYTKAEIIEDAWGRPDFLVPIFIKTRWWITNYSEHPILISEAYFLAQLPGKGGGWKRFSCQSVNRVSETGELVPTSIIEKTQQVEVDAMLYTNCLGDGLTVVGLFVLVDQTGTEYRTETLRHHQVSRYQ
jgi:hypothetical protein